MSGYQLTWITDDLATGYAPMSYDDLDTIKNQGIDAIVNLCGEFCDLHEIEEQSGFEVYYLPIPDECAPDMAEMEKALEWLDEAFYLGKKVLVHCRHGIGRTGTFVTSYLLRRGLGLKLASKRLKKTRSTPTNYVQWKLLRKYGKKSGILKIREPSLESRNVVDLSVYFADYESLLRQIDDAVAKTSKNKKFEPCGQENDACCREYVELELIEVLYLTVGMNRTLKSDLRMKAIHNAVAVHRKTQQLKKQMADDTDPGNATTHLSEMYAAEKILCPLNTASRCAAYPFRPIACRQHGLPEGTLNHLAIPSVLSRLSKNVFFAFSGFFLEDDRLTFSMAETVSGRYVQEYFYYLAAVTSDG